MATAQPPPIFLTSASSILAGASTLVQHLRRQQDELVHSHAVNPSSATFANAVIPLANIDNEFRLHANMLGFYSFVSEDETLREASTKARMILDEFQAETYLRRDIFQLVNAVRQAQQKDNLDQESALFLNRLYDRHVQSGAAIEHVKQQSRFKDIQQRLGKIRAEFLENINNDQSYISFTTEELDGVPDNILNRLEETEQGRKVYLADPGDTALISYAKADTRQRLFIASQTRCSGNVPLLREAIILRHEAANLLGFPNHAALRLQERMVKTADTIQGFLDDLLNKLASPAMQSLRALGNVKSKSHPENKSQPEDQRKQYDHEPEIEPEIKPWDRDFYQRLIMEQQLSISGNQIKEYFPLQTTISRMLKQYSLLFGLRFVELTGEVVWHEDVQLFSVHEDEAGGGHFLGYLYLDLFFRPGKTPQASCYSLQPGFTMQDGTRHYPVTALLCAFEKPLAASNKPSLLRHFDVVTTFHELGHGIHDIVSKTKYACFHGPLGVPVDFGEMPSQMLEQLCWQPSQLKYLSCHYTRLDDGHEGARPESEMPDTMIEGIIRSRKLTFGPLFHLDQLHRAAFDLAINRTSSLDDATGMDPTAIWNDLSRQIWGTVGSCPQGDAALLSAYTTNTHLVSDDYEAGYYVYLFSQVYAADLFYSHFKGDIFDRELGRRFRYDVLQQGGSCDEMQSVISFLGRKPSASAFHQHLLGLTV